MNREMCWNCGKRPSDQRDDTGLCEECFREMRHREAVAEALPKAKDAIETLHRMIGSHAGVEAIKRAVETEHRTNQQLVCRVVVAILEKFADDARRGPGYYDARNEASVKFAEAVFAYVPERLRYFPYL